MFSKLLMFLFKFLIMVQSYIILL